MDSATFFIPHPHRAPVHVRTSSRRTVLDALEYGPILSRAHLMQCTDLGETTLRHAIRQLSREGVLTPQSSRNGGAVSVARYAALPILELTAHRLIWRLCDTLGGSVVATVRDRGRFRSLEDDLTALSGRVAVILNRGACGLSPKIPLQPPVLICPDRRDAKHFSNVPLPSPPSAILSPEMAAAEEMRHLPALQEATAVLLLRVGESLPVPSVTLFEKSSQEDRHAPFIPSSVTADLHQTIRSYLGDSPSCARDRWARLAAFLGDLCRFIRLDVVILETDRPQEASSLLRASLPPTVKLIRARYGLNTPSLAHRGALRIARRALWESMEEKPAP